MDREVLVYVDLKATPHLVGRLWARVRKERESATFEYDKSWLGATERFSLEPALKLGPGPFHTPSDKPRVRDLQNGETRSARPKNGLCPWSLRALAAMIFVPAP